MSRDVSLHRYDTIKRVLDDDDDHGTPINNKETLQKLLKRYRVNPDEENEPLIVCISLGYACGCNEPSTHDRFSQ